MNIDESIRRYAYLILSNIWVLGFAIKGEIWMIIIAGVYIGLLIRMLQK